MPRVKLDAIDRRILSTLQDNGRITNVKLSQGVGISPPPCLRRVRALEQAGFIRGYHADVDAEALGFGVTVFAQVGLHNQAEPDLLAFEALVVGWNVASLAKALAPRGPPQADLPSRLTVRLEGLAEADGRLQAVHAPEGVPANLDWPWRRLDVRATGEEARLAIALAARGPS